MAFQGGGGGPWPRHGWSQRRRRTTATPPLSRTAAWTAAGGVREAGRQKGSLGREKPPRQQSPQAPTSQTPPPGRPRPPRQMRDPPIVGHAGRPPMLRAARIVNAAPPRKPPPALPPPPSWSPTMPFEDGERGSDAAGGKRGVPAATQTPEPPENEPKAPRHHAGLRVERFNYHVGDDDSRFLAVFCVSCTPGSGSSRASCRALFFSFQAVKPTNIPQCKLFLTPFALVRSSRKRGRCRQALPAPTPHTEANEQTYKEKHPSTQQEHTARPAPCSSRQSLLTGASAGPSHPYGSPSGHATRRALRLLRASTTRGTRANPTSSSTTGGTLPPPHTSKSSC